MGTTLFLFVSFIQAFAIANEVIVSDCDILIGGGSLSAVAAAITAANTSQSLKICLLEPTDWAGGQLTSSSVPPDFGPENQAAINLPQSFVSLLSEITGPDWSFNPGMCWVSTKCFESSVAAEKIFKILQQFPSIKVFYNTVVSSSHLNRETNNIDELVAIQRKSIDPTFPWTINLSEELTDWYNPQNSKYYQKTKLTFTNFKVIIEGTEFGDILMTSDIPVSQGYEYPDESSMNTNSLCGQATVFPFHMSYGYNEFDSSSVPSGSNNEVNFTLDGLSWNQHWTYRRSVAVNVKQSENTIENPTVNQGEQSNINLNNDYTSAYLFQSIEQIKQQKHQVTNEKKESSTYYWDGGINIEALKEAELRSYGFYHYLLDIYNTSGNDITQRQYFGINNTQVGTQTGLSKVPYMRDTRRSVLGIHNFRLLYEDLSYDNPEDNGKTSKHFEDTVGIGNYMYADIHKLEDNACLPLKRYPEYLVKEQKPIKPYYIPFRAITSHVVANLLLSGKTISQSFHANAGTRLHPTEWVIGVACGASASLMIQNQYQSTSDVYDNISVLQELLRSDTVKSPLEWTF